MRRAICEIVTTPRHVALVRIVKSLLMRRWFASLLLVVLLGPIAPPFFSAPAPVHACCRRNGRHHCAAPAQSDGFSSVAAICPYRRSAALLSHSTTALRIAAQTLLLNANWSDSTPFPSPRVSQNSSLVPPKRGPP